jgi:hypothetical protein
VIYLIVWIILLDSFYDFGMWGDGGTVLTLAIEMMPHIKPTL